MYENCSIRVSALIEDIELAALYHLSCDSLQEDQGSLEWSATFPLAQVACPQDDSTFAEAAWESGAVAWDGQAQCQSWLALASASNSRLTGISCLLWSGRARSSGFPVNAFNLRTKCGVSAPSDESKLKDLVSSPSCAQLLSRADCKSNVN